MIERPLDPPEAWGCEYCNPESLDKEAEIIPCGQPCPVPAPVRKDSDTEMENVNMTFEKTWPTNYHEDYYATRHGWIHLGSDKEYDYYVNHRWKLTSIVYGPEPNEYISGMYAKYSTPDNEWTRNPNNPEDIYPYTQLRKLIQAEAKTYVTACNRPEGHDDEHAFCTVSQHPLKTWR